MGILSMLQEVLSVLEIIIKVSAIMTLAIVIWGLMIYVAGILLDLLLSIVLCVLEHILPDNRAARKDNYPHRITETPSPPIVTSYSLSINGTSEDIRGIGGHLKEVNDEQFY